jgi:hypothetical protein
MIFLIACVKDIKKFVKSSLAERISNEETHETSAVISECQNAGKSKSGIGIFACTQQFQSSIGIAQL